MDFSNLKAFIDYMAAERTPGCSVKVCLGGKEVFSYAAGYSDIEDKIPYTGEEHLNIYSCSKVATATAGVQLLEQGKIRLNDPLYDYIPEYKKMYVKDSDGNITEAKKPILVGDLFSMTAGFNYDLNSPSVKKAGELTGGKYNTAEVVRKIAEEPIYYEPGEKWRYSLCHDVLAGLVEIVSGERFRDYMKKNIFEPLGMNNSVYHATPEIKEKMASQYTFVPDGAETVEDIVAAQMGGKAKDGYFKKMGKGNHLVPGEEYDSGGAGIITTVGDYVKLAAALAGGGKGMNGERILSSHAVELMKVNRMDAEKLDYIHNLWGQLRGYGYGLGVRTHIDPAGSGSMSPIGEFGWAGAAGASFLADTENDLAIFFGQHCLNPREEWYQPRLYNITYGCLDR